MDVDDPLLLIPKYAGRKVLDFLSENDLLTKVLLDLDDTVSDQKIISENWNVSDMALKNRIHKKILFFWPHLHDL